MVSYPLGRLMALLAIFSALPLCAKSPTIIVNGDPPLNFTVVTSESFGFGADPLGGGYFGFTNNSGVSWMRLDIFVTLPSFETITCGSSAFVTCTVTTTTPAGSSPASYDLIFGPDSLGGVVNKQNFTIDLNDNGIVNLNPNGAGSWGTGTDFEVVANAPEPKATLLGGLGLLTLAFYLLAKRRLRAVN